MEEWEMGISYSSECRGCPKYGILLDVTLYSLKINMIVSIGDLERRVCIMFQALGDFCCQRMIEFARLIWSGLRVMFLDIL